MTPEETVLAQVRPGHAAILNLRPEQREALADPFGLIALSHLAHLLYARAHTDLAGRFPLVERFEQRLGSRLQQRLADKKARDVTKRLADAGVIERDGGYGRDDGSYIPTWRVTVAVWVDEEPIRRFLRASGPMRPRRFLASLGKQARVKRVPWWKHPEFGTHDGRPPPGTSAASEEHWRREGHWKEEARRAVLWLAAKPGEDRRT